MNGAHSEDRNMDQDVTQLILQDILAGAYPPGTWLKQIDLEMRYGRGRNEIRRALDRLTQKRVVEHVPNKGYNVFITGEKQWQDIANIRIMLETGIVDKVIAQAVEADLKRLRKLADVFQSLVFSGTLLQLYEANLKFHYAFVDLANNRELHTVIAELRQRTSSAPVAQWKTRERVEQSAKEHHQMVDALAAKDKTLLCALIEQHIRQRPSS